MLYFLTRLRPPRSTLTDTLFPYTTPVRSFLINALDHPDYVAGTVDTILIGRDGDAMTEEPMPTAQALTNAAMAMVPRALQAGFRLNAPDVRTAPFLLDGKRVEVELHGPRSEEQRLNSSH